MRYTEIGSDGKYETIVQDGSVVAVNMLAPNQGSAAPQALGEDGACNLTAYQTRLTADLVNATLADGVIVGQIKRVTMAADGTGDVTCATPAFTSDSAGRIWFLAENDSVLFQWTEDGWVLLELVGGSTTTEPS